MSISANIPDRVKTELNLAIAEAVRTYQNENDRYFSRKRILDVETMMKLLISMQGGSLQKELHEAGISATASAFVQNRKNFHGWILKRYWMYSTPIIPIPKLIKDIEFLLLMVLRLIFQEIPNRIALCVTKVHPKVIINCTSRQYKINGEKASKNGLLNIM